MNDRMKKAEQIMATPGYCSQLDKTTFSVRSQTDHEKRYNVSITENGLVCECPDHQDRKSDCKHIKIVLDVMKKNQCYRNNTFKIMERAKLKKYKFCDSGNIKKWGVRKTKNGEVQRFKCLDCKKRFSTNFGFEKKQFDESIITQTMQIYYSKMSVRRIADHFEMIGIDVSFKTIYNWISQYSEMTSKYLDSIVPRVGDWFRADEVWVKIAGEQKYLFASMDDDT